MEHKKSIRVRIDPWDRQRMVKYLEAQAQKGWMFCGFEEKKWNFRLIEPKKVHFYVTYFLGYIEDNAYATQKLLEFREYCAHDGWELAGAYEELQVFYSLRENPTPIETDPKLEVRTMQIMALRKLQPELKHNGGHGVFYVLLGLLGLHVNPIRAFQYVLLHLWFLTYFGKLLVALLRVAEQYLWHWQAKRYVSRYDEFPHHLKRLRISSVVDALVDIAHLWMIVWQLGVIHAAGLIAACLCAAAAIIYAMRWIDRQFFLSSTNRILKVTGVIAILVVCFSLVYGVMALFHVELDRYAPLGSAWAKYEEAPPLSAEEYYGDGAQQIHYSSWVEESVFLAEYNAWMDAKLEEEWFYSRYTVLEVKWDALYDMCLSEYMDSECFPVDAAPWGAEQAYRYGTEAEPKNVWLLCYDNRIVDISIEEPTPDQMALVGQVLGNEQNFDKNENK